MRDNTVNLKTLRIRIYVGLITLFLATIIAPTIAEFLVSLHNRFRIYPPGTDTSMLALTLMVEFILIALLTLVLLRWLVGLSWIWSVLASALISMFVGWFIFMYGFPSMLPQSWCKYELRIYSCEDFETNTQWVRNGIL